MISPLGRPSDHPPAKTRGRHSDRSGAVPPAQQPDPAILPLDSRAGVQTHEMGQSGVSPIRRGPSHRLRPSGLPIPRRKALSINRKSPPLVVSGCLERAGRRCRRGVWGECSGKKTCCCDNCTKSGCCHFSRGASRTYARRQATVGRTRGHRTTAHGSGQAGRVASTSAGPGSLLAPRSIEIAPRPCRSCLLRGHWLVFSARYGGARWSSPRMPPQPVATVEPVASSWRWPALTVTLRVSAERIAFHCWIRRLWKG
jgi:hypothetical protein